MGAAFIAGFSSIIEFFQSGQDFLTKNELTMHMINRIMKSSLFYIQWIGCDAAYGNDHAFLDGLKLPEGVWYFVATNAKEQIFREYPEMVIPKTKHGRPRKETGI